jgi:hypothetical protein
MKRKIPLLLPALALALMLAPPPLSAQQQQDAPKPGPDPGGGFDAGPTPAQPQRPTLADARFDVEFVDTPVPEACTYVADIVEDLTGDPINIVISPEAEDIVLPKMHLRRITFEQFVSFINRIGGADALQSGGGAFGSMDAGGGMPIPHTGPSFGIAEANGIWYFWAEKETEKAPAEPPEEKVELLTRVFPLDGDTEAILALIEEALSESRRHGKKPEPTLKFHEPSGTLIATGSVEDLQLIDDVVRVMEMRESKLQKSKADAGIHYMEQELERLRGHLVSDHPAIIELEKRLEGAIAERLQKR